MEKKEQAKRLLAKYNQEHIKVNSEEIANQILNIDFEQLQELYEEIGKKTDNTNIDNIEPVKAINPAKLDKKNIDEYISIGENKVKSGKFAVAIMAGGQGTRLRTQWTKRNF